MTDPRLWQWVPPVPGHKLVERVHAVLAGDDGALSTSQVAERLGVSVADTLDALRVLQRSGRAAGWIDGAAPLANRVLAALEDGGGTATPAWIARAVGIGTSILDVEQVLLDLQGEGRAAPCVATPGTWMLPATKGEGR